MLREPDIPEELLVTSALTGSDREMILTRPIAQIEDLNVFFDFVKTYSISSRDPDG